VRRLIPFVLLLGLLPIVGCVAGAPSPGDAREHVPEFPGFPQVAQYSGTECKTVLTIGDSLMFEAQPYLQGALESSGRCSIVHQAALGGTGPVGTGGGLHWLTRLTTLMADYQPDIVVMEFVGNSNDTGLVYGSLAWAAAQNQATVDLVNIATAGGAEVYVMAAPTAAMFCFWDLAGTAWTDYRAFVRGLAGVGHGDWSNYLSPGDVYAQRMSFGGVVQDIRLTDCTHFTPLGASIAAAVTAAAIAGEW
jgi:hypothetical protein